MVTNSLEWTMAESSAEQSEEGTALRGMSTRAIRERHLLTSSTMPMLNLFEPYGLNTYSGTALGLSTEQGRPYRDTCNNPESWYGLDLL